MKILVTGYTGLIGKSLARSLSTLGYEVFVWPKSSILDLRSRKDVDLYFHNKFFDVVVHCAIKGTSDTKSKDWSIMDTNLQMYYNLLAKRDHFDKFISIGSGAEFFMNDKSYGLSKRVIHHSIEGQDNFYNLRVFGIFDENELDTRFVKSNVLRYIKKEPMIIYQDRHMDFIYMEDFIKIVKHYIECKDLKKTVDCVYPDTYKLSDIANIINTLDKYKVQIDIKEKDLAEGYCAFTKLISLDFIGMASGIRNVYNKLK